MKRRPVEEGDYGIVRVVRGTHTGKLGYYDDDAIGRAIVYLDGHPVNLGDYVLIWRKWLVVATEAEARRWHALFDNDIVNARAARRFRERRD